MLISTELPCDIKMNSCSYVLDLLTRGRSTFPYGCPVPLDQGYGGLQGPDIRSCSPRGLWCGKLVLTTHIHQILLFGTGLYPRFPGALILVLLAWFHTGQALVAMVMLYWRSQSVLTQRSSLERERSVTTVTSVPWRGNERCVPGHISFVPVSEFAQTF